jgi:hypothetical protein
MVTTARPRLAIGVAALTLAVTGLAAAVPITGAMTAHPARGEPALQYGGLPGMRLPGEPWGC